MTGVPRKKSEKATRWPTVRPCEPTRVESYPLPLPYPHKNSKPKPWTIPNSTFPSLLLFLSRRSWQTMSMATDLISFRPIGIRACAASGGSHRRSTSSNWWTPLFGWSPDPDYIDPETKTPNPVEQSRSEQDLETKTSRSRYAPGCFTEEKAKQLRLVTTSTSSFHDAMYHSAIASRLASDFKKRSDLWVRLPASKE